MNDEIETIGPAEMIKFLALIKTVLGREVSDDPFDILTLRNIKDVMDTMNSEVNRLLDGYSIAMNVLVSTIKELPPERREYIASVILPYHFNDDMMHDMQNIIAHQKKMQEKFSKKEASGYAEAEDIKAAKNSTKH